MVTTAMDNCTHHDSAPASADIAAAGKPRHIYIDCTSTYFTGLNTGIQRVVRGLVERDRMLTEHIGVPCIPVIALRGHYWRFPSSERTMVQDVLENSTEQRSSGRGRFGRFEQAILALGRRLHVPKAVTAAPLHIARRTLAAALCRFHSTSTRRILRKNGARFIRAQTGDLLLIPDAFWGPHGQVSAIKRFSVEGGAVLPVVHDVTPLTHSTFFPDSHVGPFRAGLRRVLSAACGVLTVSRTVMADVGRYCAEEGYGHLPLDYVYSGADIASQAPNATASVRPDIAAHCEARPFLMVGTVEPRKDYQTALDGYERYLGGGGQRPLVIVGRLGWLELDVVARMRAMTHSSKPLFFYPDVSDAELAALYQRASALIFASRYEGFGLPLVEAMHQGLPVIASDIPVFQEIGQDYPVYFQMGDAEDLRRALWEHDQGGGGRSVPRPWPTWDEAAPSYIDKAVALYAQSHLGAE
ncbi:glycosyltransferase family 4 protein [Acidiferrobacter sp.]